jgi:hypothetical protein
VEIVDTHLPLDQGQGAGIALTSGSTLTARRCRIAGSEGIGIYTTGSALTLEEVEIVDNLPDGDGRYGIGILAVQGSEIRALATRVHGNHHAGIAAMESQLELVDTVLSGNLRSTSSTSGPGLYLQQSSVTAQGLVSSGNDGPGAVVADGSLTCTGCTMEDNSFAGLVLYSGALELVDSTVVDTRADVNEGGGYGVLAAELDAPSTITVNGSTLSGHPEAALVFAGAGTFTVEECTLADSAGTGGPTLSGIGLAAVGSDPGSNSVQLSQSILEGLGGAAVFVDGMTTELYENTYQDNGVDLVVQQCDETGTGTADWTADSVATTDICPTYDYPFELGSYAVFLEDIAIDFRR